jgi:hypothetical protein
VLEIFIVLFALHSFFFSSLSDRDYCSCYSDHPPLIPRFDVRFYARFRC